MKRLLGSILVCLLLVGMSGTVASASDLDWKTTNVREEANGILCVTGYFTNNRVDRIITKINWFQPNVTLTLPSGETTIFLDEVDNSQRDCYIEPGCTYEMGFYINGAGQEWIQWKTRPKFNYRYSTIQG